MPKMVLLAAYLNLASNDLSEYARKIEVTAEVEDKDVTNYASAGWKEVLPGLASGELGLELLQDVAATELDSIMWPLFIARQNVPFRVRLNNAAVSTSNPEYSGSVLIKGWNPIQGSIGDEASVSVTYPTSGAITRTTA
ncbi:hypothetical protein PV728_01740 [Streptomyces europaeiscabiei]|uniref:hypothetical protein n=1 Tax=Streptomyces europaeiscabiei TaxID=146819 RepID=UPI0029BA9B8B|nr:hypothetical protein [Streptomyces europaeiscabiei]MDX3629051.1 hypothetical protein [Streptomyces europaeiscabiei]MDX3647331.1 hypothetical protein [Streptomyces europaeiscabiei]